MNLWPGPDIVGHRFTASVRVRRRNARAFPAFSDLWVRVRRGWRGGATRVLDLGRVS